MTEQKPLFGDLDQVINTLETEASAISKQVLSGHESLTRKEEEIAKLEERLGNLRASLAHLRVKAKEADDQAGEKKEVAPF